MIDFHGVGEGLFDRNREVMGASSCMISEGYCISCKTTCIA